MSKFRIATFGWRHSRLDQISRVEQGLRDLGHTISYENPDFCFSNNPTFEEILEFAAKWPKTKIILNVLDLPTHVLNYPFELLKTQLKCADAITSISQTTQNALKKVLGLDSTVIYNPLKKTYRNPEIKKDLFCVYAGRNGDSNKRFSLVVDTLKKLNTKQEDFVCCGPECPPWGTYYGIVSDEILNDLYNRAKYYICPSQNVGIECPPLEASFCGAIPIECNDNPTAFEFLERFFITDPTAAALAAKIQEIEKNRVEHSSYFIQTSPMRYQKLSGLSVAKKIIEVYNSL